MHPLYHRFEFGRNKTKVYLDEHAGEVAHGVLIRPAEHGSPHAHECAELCYLVCIALYPCTHTCPQILMSFMVLYQHPSFGSELKSAKGLSHVCGRRNLLRWSNNCCWETVW